MVLTMELNANRTGIVFDVQHDAPSLVKGSSAQKREYDKQLASGTMSRSGVTCPCCSTIMTTEDIRREAQVGRLSIVMTTVVVDGQNGKDYRLPTKGELELTREAEIKLKSVFSDIPFGLPI